MSILNRAMSTDNIYEYNHVVPFPLLHQGQQYVGPILVGRSRVFDSEIARLGLLSVVPDMGSTQRTSLVVRCAFVQNSGRIGQRQM